MMTTITEISDATIAPAKRVRLPRLRSLNTPLAEQERLRSFRSDLMAADCYAGSELGVWEGRRYIGSQQGVVVFRQVTRGDELHPDAHAYFDADELAEFIDDAAEKRLIGKDSLRHMDVIPDSHHGAMVTFMSASQEKAQVEYEAKIVARQAKKRRRAERAGHRVEISLAPDVDAAEAAAKRKEADYPWDQLSRLVVSRHWSSPSLPGLIFRCIAGPVAGLTDMKSRLFER
jgi:hypothetical protein